MSFGIPVRNGLGVGLLASTFLSSLRIGGRPAMSLDFIGTNSLDSRITFTRASTATFVGSDGLIQTAAINAPRFDYDPVTFEAQGLLIEETRENLFLNSLINGTSLSTQSVTVTAVPHTISFYGTGTITLSGAATATVVGTGAYPNRQTLTFTPIVGLLVCTVTGSVQYAQVEAGSFATSFIPTAAAKVTRSADVALMTGTNFSSWYNQSEGTVVCNWRPSNVGGEVIAQISASTNTNRIQFVNSNSQQISVNAGGVGQGAIDAGTINVNAVNRLAYGYRTNNTALSLNGGAVATDLTVTLPVVDRFCIGATVVPEAFLNGRIRSIAYYNTRLSNSQLQGLTA